jgi:hypothetical protein
MNASPPEKTPIDPGSRLATIVRELLETRDDLLGESLAHPADSHPLVLAAAKLHTSAELLAELAITRRRRKARRK